MNRFKFLFSCLIFCLSHLACAQLEQDTTLPVWRDPVLDQPRYSFLPKLSKESIPTDSFHVRAEYEPVRAVLISGKGSRLSSMLQDIMWAAYEKGHAEIWAANLSSVNFPIHPDYLYQSQCQTDSNWMRDYGPIGMLSDGSLGMANTIYNLFRSRPNDDEFPNCLSQEMGLEAFDLPLLLDGGNFMVDSLGTLFMTKATYRWNPEKSQEDVDYLLKRFFNVKKIVAVDYAGYPDAPVDKTGHIDMFLKLINDHTFVLAETKDEPFNRAFKRVYKQLKELTAPDGEPYRIIRVPGWYDYSVSVWYTYTNSLLVNHKLLMPDFSGHRKDTALATARYLEAGGAENLEVIPINSDHAILLGGSIHCLTQTIPAFG